MAQHRITISIDQGLAVALRDIAAGEGTTVSAVVSDALEREVRSRGLSAAIEAWEAEHGRFTDDEIARAREELGW